MHAHRCGGAAVHRATARERSALAHRGCATVIDRGRRAQPRRAGVRRARLSRSCWCPTRSCSHPSPPRGRAGRGRALSDHLHERHRGRAEGRAARPALPPRPAPAGEALAGRAQGRARVVHRLLGLEQVGAECFHLALAARRERAAARRALRSGSATGAVCARARERAVHGTHRVPRDRRPRDARRAAGPAHDGRGRRGAESRGAARLARGHGPRDPRRVRPDRDGADDRDGPCGERPPRLDGQAAAGRDAHDRGR